MKESRAYNDSILFMVAMPYLLLGACGGYVWWNLRKQPAGGVAERADADGPGPAA